jgi:hypothetical protein
LVGLIPPDWAGRSGRSGGRSAKALTLGGGKRRNVVDKDRIRKVLKGVTVAGLAAGVMLATTGCKSMSCGKGSCGGKQTEEGSGSCGKGSCAKGSCGSKSK